jgi:hypothetical protein
MIEQHVVSVTPRVEELSTGEGAWFYRARCTCGVESHVLDQQQPGERERQSSSEGG